MKTKNEEVIEQLTIRMFEIKETLIKALDLISEIVWINNNPDSIKPKSKQKGKRK